VDEPSDEAKAAVDEVAAASPAVERPTSSKPVTARPGAKEDAGKATAS
jgi:hypothetical protein